MKDLRAFFAQNLKPADSVTYVATERLIDPETGKPPEWEITPVTANENLEIRRGCMKMVPIPGKKNQYSQNIDANAYTIKLAVRCTTFPNLNDADLQDSYGVMSAEQLLGAMLDPGELDEYTRKVLEVNGFEKTESDLVDEAKN